MKDSKKMIIICIIVVLIICVICGVLLYLSNNKDNGNANEVQQQLTDENGSPIGDTVDVEYSNERLNDPTRFFSVEKYIQDNYNENFVAEDMNVLYSERITSYAVQGRIGDNSENKVYFIFRVDPQNSTYSMEEQDNVNSLDSIDLRTDITEINNTGNNTFEYTTVNSEQMCRIYLNDYKDKELNNPEEAYSMLDDEYKKIRFPTYEDFQEYLNEYRNIIQNSVLTSYYSEIKDDYTEYILVDNYNNSYTVRSTGIWDYKIMLDNYTIKVDTYEKEYSNLDDEAKVQANIHIFLQMINTKDYTHAYEKLADGFKSNYFNTLESFEDYMKNNWFSYNILADIDISEEANSYVCNVTLRDGAGSAANQTNKTIIMQLREGTDYVMSFTVE